MENRQSLNAMVGIQIITYEEGVRLGKVSDVYIDREKKKVEGISFSTGRIGFGDTCFVSFGDIQCFGRDAIIISRESSATSLSSPPEFLGIKAVKAMKVMTSHGEDLGMLRDVSFNKSSGLISGLNLDNGELDDIRPDELTLGADAVLLPAEYASRISNPEEKPTTFSTLPIDVEGVKSKLKESAQKIENAAKSVFGKYKSDLGAAKNETASDEYKETIDADQK